MENERVYRGELVANALREVTHYTTVEDLAKMANMDYEKFKNSIGYARNILAKEGLFLVNKFGDGYKVGNFDEFVDEIDKACKRSLSQITSKAKLINLLKSSGKAKDDFKVIEDVIRTNLHNIQVLFDEPDRTEFGSVEEYYDAKSEFYSDNNFVPDFIRFTPMELVDPENPDGLSD